MEEVTQGQQEPSLNFPNSSCTPRCLHWAPHLARLPHIVRPSASPLPALAYWILQVSGSKC